jgi:branched-chain amino acid transport system ATP-binding protein
LNILEINHLSKKFGGLTAVDDFNLALEKGRIFGLIGPNGSGKTTVFNVITGFYSPNEGSIHLAGEEITSLSPDRVTGKGLSRIFQNSRVFKNRTVFDNVMIGNHLRLRSNLVAAILNTPGYAVQDADAVQQTLTLLEGLDLVQYADEKAGALPYGLQRKLEVARALSTKPKVLLLDEPATGMTVEETSEMMDFILSLREDYDLTILIIEHHMQVIMGICEYIKVLNYGKTIAAGTASEIQNNNAVIEAYLGAG